MGGRQPALHLLGEDRAVIRSLAAPLAGGTPRRVQCDASESPESGQSPSPTATESSPPPAHAQRDPGSCGATRRRVRTPATGSPSSGSWHRRHPRGPFPAAVRTPPRPFTSGGSPGSSTAGCWRSTRAAPDPGRHGLSAPARRRDRWHRGAAAAEHAACGLVHADRPPVRCRGGLVPLRRRRPGPHVTAARPHRSAVRHPRHRRGAGPLRHVRHRRTGNRRLPPGRVLAAPLLAGTAHREPARARLPRGGSGTEAGEGPCRGAARADAPDPLDFQWGYEWPTAEQWANGQTYGICWAPV